MSAEHYCETKLLIPGSNDYYAWRFTSPRWQPTWLALATLQQTLWDIVLNYREASVAQAKLLWWSEEIARTINGQPEHPVTQALVAALPEIAKEQGLLTEWIEGVMAAMLCQHLCTDADFSLMAKRSIAIPALLLCRYQNLQDEHTLKLISQQSELLLFDYYLRQHQRLLSQGQVWVPLQRLSESGLSLDNLADSSHTKILQQLLQHWLDALYQPHTEASRTAQPKLDAAIKSRHVGDRGDPTVTPADSFAQPKPIAPTLIGAKTDYIANWRALNANQQAILKYPHTLTRIAYKRCAQLLKRPDFTWTTPHNDLTPLAKLWLAWRQ